MAGNQSVSVYFGFGRFSVFQREGYWDFQNHTLSNDKAKTKAYKITLRIDKNHKLKTFHTDHSKAKSPFTWKNKSQYKRNKTSTAKSVKKKLTDYMRIWDIRKIREVEICYSWSSLIWSEEKKLTERERESERLKNLSEESFSSSILFSVCVKQSHRTEARRVERNEKKLGKGADEEKNKIACSRVLYHKGYFRIYSML